MSKLIIKDKNLEETINLLEDIRDEGVFKNMKLRSIHSSNFSMTDGVILDKDGKELEEVPEVKSAIVIFSAGEDDKTSPCYIAVINNSNEKFIKVYTGVLFEGTLLPSIEEEPNNIGLDEDKIIEALKESEEKIEDRVKTLNEEAVPVSLTQIEIAMFKGILGYLSNFPSSLVDKGEKVDNNLDMLKNYYDIILASDSSQFIKRAIELEKSVAAFNNDKGRKERMFGTLREIKKASEALTSTRQESELKDLIEKVGEEKALKLLKAL